VALSRGAADCGWPIAAVQQFPHNRRDLPGRPVCFMIGGLVRVTQQGAPRSTGARERPPRQPHNFREFVASGEHAMAPIREITSAEGPVAPVLASCRCSDLEASPLCDSRVPLAPPRLIRPADARPGHGPPAVISPARAQAQSHAIPVRARRALLLDAASTHRLAGSP
jgi:hypothetical protein